MHNETCFTKLVCYQMATSDGGDIFFLLHDLNTKKFLVTKNSVDGCTI